MSDEPQDVETGVTPGGTEPDARRPDPAAADDRTPGGPPAPPDLLPPPSAPLPPTFEPVLAGGLSQVAPPAPAVQAGPGRRILFPLFLLGLAVLITVLGVFRVHAAASAAYKAGMLVGSLIGIAFGSGLVLIVARTRFGRTNVARNRMLAASTAVLLAIVGVQVAGISGVAGAAPTVDPAPAMVIAAPYTLEPATPDVLKSFGNASQNKAKVEARMVLDGQGTTVGILVGTEGQQTAAFWDEFDRSFEQSSGGSVPSPTLFHGETARTFHVSSVSGIAWIGDGGVLMAVYAKSDTTAMAIAEAQYKAITSPGPAASQ